MQFTPPPAFSAAGSHQMSPAVFAGRDHQHQIDQQLANPRTADALENLSHTFARRPTDRRLRRFASREDSVGSSASETPRAEPRRKNDGRTSRTRLIFRTCWASIGIAPLSKASTSRSVAPMRRASSRRVRSLKIRVRRSRLPIWTSIGSNRIELHGSRSAARTRSWRFTQPMRTISWTRTRRTFLKFER